MASTREYLFYVLDLLREIDGISYKKMMGEYILYKDGILFGGVYDNRFLIKRTKSNKNSGFTEQIPYPGGGLMYLIESEDSNEIKEIICRVVSDLRK